MARVTAREALSYGMFGKTAFLQQALDGNGSIYSGFRTLVEATRQLRDAIAAGRVEAWGFRENPGAPALHDELLPKGAFSYLKSLAIDHLGKTTFLHPASPEDIPGWRDITFEMEQIKALWPVTDKALDHWMSTDFANHPEKKRAARLQDCRSANRCTTRAAEASYRRTPSENKRGQGERLKKARLV